MRDRTPGAPCVHGGELTGPAGVTIWLTGLPAAGKTTLARALAARLQAEGRTVVVLDGDEVRATGMSRDLGFSKEDRNENVRRVGEEAARLSGEGAVVLCALVSPYRNARDAIRTRHGDRFVEVFVSAPLEVCQGRDVKGLYARQRHGSLTGLTGVDDPYEPPSSPEVEVPTHRLTVEQSVDLVVAHLPVRFRHG